MIPVYHTHMANEFEYIRWLRDQTPAHARVTIGPGDDCAAIALPDREMLITTDMLMEGVDYVLAEAGPRRIGRKAMSVNLSDIAAMAGRPVAAVVSVALPQGVSIAEELYRGLREVADEFRVPIVGGDTNSWKGGLVINVTVYGEVAPGQAVRRNGACPGDWIFVTGPLGGSILGHHLDFLPRIPEAQRLQANGPIHAMIDISDGFTADLSHILQESRCGAMIFGAQIPLSAAAHTCALQSGRSALDHALTDGEDFELIVVVGPEVGSRWVQQPPIPSLVEVGRIVPTGLFIDRGEGAGPQPLASGGWEHAW
ncbi:MAG: thiamine-phosphate kinase [Gemmataceae bacterium]